MEIIKATLAYLESEGKILMLEKGVRTNDPNSTKFTQPGGKINPGETPMQAIEREFPEETGLELLDPVYVGTVLFDNSERLFSGMPAKKHFLVHVFRARKYRGELRGTSEGTPTWVEKIKLAGLNRHEGDTLLDNFVDSGRKFSAVIYHIGTKVSHEKSYVTYFD
jgi:ADP-ribose pyrophosphatase YjhB (NUDIX family)